jgi:intein/homing endonuclease
MDKSYRILIKKYLSQHSIIDANIKSFNNFIEKRMQEIIKDIGDIIPTIIPPDIEEFKIRLDKVWITNPELIEADGSKREIYPIEARLRKLTYSSPIFLEVSAHVDGVQVESFTTQVGRLPIMVKSKFCNLYNASKEKLIEAGEDPTDPGGYFILNGNERILVMVEDLAPNKLFVERLSSDPSKYKGRVFSEGSGLRIPHSIEQLKDGVIYLSFTRFKRVPIIAVIKALGLIKDQEITKIISEEKQYDDIFINLYKCLDLKTQDDALEFIAKEIGLTLTKEEKIKTALEQIDKYLLPHLGSSKADRITKAYNLCKIIKRFLMVSKEHYPSTDKDHYMNKRVKLAGDLLEDLFRVNLRVLVNDMLYNFQRLVKRGKFHSIKVVIRDKLLTSRIQSSMATGSWPGDRQGISQNMDRTNFLATLSHLQRVVSLLSSSQENFEARALHPSHWGRLCLKKDTNILLADKYDHRTLEELQNCWNHHKVATFDASGRVLRPSAISKYYTSNPKLMGKKVYKFISESGREITATEDHPFYTENGWINASKLIKGDKVAVYPTLDTATTPRLPTQNLGEFIVTDTGIKKIAPHRYRHYIKELHSKELLPLTVNNYKTEIIARLLGHLFSDGHCGKYNLEFYSGDKEDAGAIANDIRLLGFEPSRISEKHTKIKKDDKTVNYRTFTLTKGGALHSLLVAAGAPLGKKTDIPVGIPKWLFKSNLSVKREFLGALLGGDGPKPRVRIRKDRKSGSKLHLDDMIFHKVSRMKNNIVKFSNDLKCLFNELGIITKYISIEEDYTRKDGSVMLKCKIHFGKSCSNVKSLLTKIGYRYCIQKEKEANYIGEWLRLRDHFVKERVHLKNKVKKLYNDGVTPKKISSILSLKYRVVQGWIFNSSRYAKTRLSQNMLLPYEKWLELSKLGESGAVWEKIVYKEFEDLNDVRDFTTAEDTHSFIANGFITHNCPVETPEGTPIGLRKNLAMLSSITHDYVDEDNVKALLETIGVKKIK